MPKDPEIYRYITVGLEWDSWTLEQLEKDAKASNMTKHLGKLIGMRLKEHYEAQERSRQQGPLPMMYPAAALPILPQGGNTPLPVIPHTPMPPPIQQELEVVPEIIEAANDVEGNADEAADAWGSLDDDW